jgi:hypothetical protein
MKHSITFLAAAALVGATFSAKADNDIKPNPNPPPPKSSTSGSGQQDKEPGITDKGHDLDADSKTGPRTRDDVLRDILKDRYSK